MKFLVSYIFLNIEKNSKFYSYQNPFWKNFVGLTHFLCSCTVVHRGQKGPFNYFSFWFFMARIKHWDIELDNWKALELDLKISKAKKELLVRFFWIFLSNPLHKMNFLGGARESKRLISRDLSRDDCIEEFIKRIWSSGLVWAVGLQSGLQWLKNSQMH